MRLPLTCRGYTLTVLLVIVVGCARARDEDAVVRLAMPPIPHGFDTYSREERLRIARDGHALRTLKALMDGKLRTSVHWDSAVVIWWLAESGDTAYVPVFVAGTRAADTTALFTYSVYGLARCASSPVAERRLEELARFGTAKTRETAIAFLALVNDSAARRVLRPLLPAKVPDWVSRHVSTALAGTEVPHELARWPSLKR